MEGGKLNGLMTRGISFSIVNKMISKEISNNYKFDKLNKTIFYNSEIFSLKFKKNFN